MRIPPVISAGFASPALGRLKLAVLRGKKWSIAGVEWSIIGVEVDGYERI